MLKWPPPLTRKDFNLIEGFKYYFIFKQLITWERITNFKLKIMSEYSRKKNTLE